MHTYKHIILYIEGNFLREFLMTAGDLKFFFPVHSTV